MSSLKGKTVTVFGGTGFIGRYVVQRLARLGARVVVATRNPEHVLSLKMSGDVGQIVPITGRLQDDAFVAAAVKGSFAVVNLIGILFENGRSTFKDVQGEFPARLAAAAHKAGAHSFVHVSAIGANEQAKAQYAASKGAGEKGVRAHFSAATILRPSIVMGAEDGFFNRFAQMALMAPALPLIGGGKTRFQPVFVGDVADAIVASISYDGARGKTFELGGPATFTFKELMQLMLRMMGRKRCLIGIPFWLAALKAFFLQLLPNPMLTLDQVELLKTDNIVASSTHTFRDLGITPTAIETVLPTYMDKYREGGRYNVKKAG